LPHNYLTALRDTTWRLAMQEEYDALMANNTWTLVPPPPGANIVSGKWIFLHKYNSDGSLTRHKARWVVRGFTQQPGINFDETFSPVVKTTTIRVVLSLALSQNWPIHQLDVKNAFLHGHLTKEVYSQQPSGFVDPSRPNHVCHLLKSLYGFKQAPRAWFQRFARFARSIGFLESKSNTSLFTLHRGTDVAYILLYVNDIILTASNQPFLHSIILLFSHEFAMKDLGPLHHFLGISITRQPHSLHLSQRQYILDVLSRAGMSDCNPSPTPIDTKVKLSASTGPSMADPFLYRSLAGALQYITHTRPEISYAVQQVCLHMHDPREPHFLLIKRILRYLKGTLDHGLTIHSTTSHSLIAYSDADWAGCPDARRSTSGYCVFLGDNLVSWLSRRQPMVSRSSAEAEYRVVATVVAETCWLCSLHQELHRPIDSATIVYCDNVSAVYQSANPVQH
jgi:hypothetical protein